MYRLYHLFFLIELNVLLTILFLYSSLIRESKGNSKRKVLALPYYPLNYAGGHSRIADWKPYFEKDGIDFDVHWASESDEFLSEFYSDSWFEKYFFYHKVLLRRFKLIFSLKNYDSIWIQRAFIPFYPFKDAFFEKALTKINRNITIDFYDADYKSNYNLTLNAAKCLPKVTVAGPYLVDFYSKKGIQVNYIPFAMKFESYIKAQEKSEDDIVIGWMGAPSNFHNVLLIEDVLFEIERKYPNVQYHFICREINTEKLKRVQHLKWGDDGFDYHNEISKFDIGIAPMLNATERDKAKTAFKTLEYMASSIAFITSPWGVSDKLKDGENCMFATSKEEWFNAIEFLINNKEKRKKLGVNSRLTLEKWHSYEKVYIKLKDVLFTKPA